MDRVGRATESQKMPKKTDSLEQPDHGTFLHHWSGEEAYLGDDPTIRFRVPGINREYYDVMLNDDGSLLVGANRPVEIEPIISNRLIIRIK